MLPLYFFRKITKIQGSTQHQILILIEGKWPLSYRSTYRRQSTRGRQLLNIGVLHGAVKIKVCGRGGWKGQKTQQKKED